MSEKDIAFAEEILRVRPKTCSNCWHNRNGDCAVYSSDCATAVTRGSPAPPRWTSYEEGEEMVSRIPMFRAKGA